jgi:hypothetical protein
MTTPITGWITSAINTNVMTQAGLANVLGVEPPAITHYLSGSVPRPRILREMVLLFRHRRDAASQKVSAEWTRLAERPLRDTHPTARGRAATLAHYVLEPVWDDFHAAVSGLPPEKQEEILNNGIAAATRASLDENERALAAAMRTRTGAGAPSDAQVHAGRRIDFPATASSDPPPPDDTRRLFATRYPVSSPPRPLTFQTIPPTAARPAPHGV